MLKGVSEFIERHELQWCLYFLLGAITLVRVPDILTEDNVDHLRGTCGMYNHHLCIAEGCFFEPAIVSVGQPRAKLLGDETPTHLEILYKVSYFRSASRIIKTKASIDCLQNYKHPVMSNIYMALIPAILTAVFIIGLLIFLKPSSEVYYLVENKEENELPLDFTIDDDSDEEICNPKEKKKDEASDENKTDDKIIQDDKGTIKDDDKITIQDNTRSFTANETFQENKTVQNNKRLIRDDCNARETKQENKIKESTDVNDMHINSNSKRDDSNKKIENDNDSKHNIEKTKQNISCTKEICDIEDDPFSCDTCDDFEVTRTTSSKPIIENTISKKKKKKLEKKIKESLKEGSTV